MRENPRTLPVQFPLLKGTARGGDARNLWHNSFVLRAVCVNSLGLVDIP